MKVFQVFASLAVIGAVSAGCVPSRANRFENLTPTSEYARRWSVDEAKQKVSGYTFLRHSPGRLNEVLFFDPKGAVYQWNSLGTSVSSGTWTVEHRSFKASDPAKVYVCTTLQNRSVFSGEELSHSSTNRCIDPSLLFIPAAEHANGDVFRIAGQREAPVQLSAERTRIQDIQKLSGSR